MNLQRNEHPDRVMNVDRFVRNYLHVDGVLLVRLIHANAGDMISSEVVEKLYELFERVGGCSER